MESWISITPKGKVIRFMKDGAFTQEYEDLNVTGVRILFTKRILFDEFNNRIVTQGGFFYDSKTPLSAVDDTMLEFNFDL